MRHWTPAFAGATTKAKPGLCFNPNRSCSRAMSGKVETGFPSDIAQIQRPRGMIRFN
jgi:hypothetical protein